MKDQNCNRLQYHLRLNAPARSPVAPATIVGKITVLIVCLVALAMVAEGQPAKLTDQQQFVTGKIPKPGNIWVYNFAATAAEVPTNSPLAGEKDLDTTPQTAEQIAMGQKLGAEIASNLVAQIRAMGMPAEQAKADSQPQINDLVIRGYLLSIQEGSAAKRLAVGFGAGASELRTLVDGFQITAEGEHELASGTVEAGGAKKPGAVLGVAGFMATKNPAGLIISSGMHIHGEKTGKSTVEGRAKATATEIAKELKKRFEKRGWIK